MTGGGTLLECLDDYFSCEDDYLLFDGLARIPEDIHGIKVFEEVWTKNIHPDDIVNIV